MTGSVAEFDEHGGFGTLEGEDGARYWFHCTAIADGSRTIAAATSVEFDVVPGRAGRWEAANIRPR